jgi:CO/xanthine dehydrogenase Mo-binding subunit
VLSAGQVAGLGYVPGGTNTMLRVLDAAGQGELYSQREQLKAQSPSRWQRRGVGLAAAWQGFGLGAGVEEGATVRLELQSSGRYRLQVGCPEMGQGNLTALAQMAAHELNCAVSDIEVSGGDTFGPDSGSSNASRTTFIVGTATIKAATELRQKILAAASRLPVGPDGPQLVGGQVRAAGQNIPLAELAAELGPLVGEGYFKPSQPQSVAPGIPHIVYSYSVQVALVEVDVLTGQVAVLRLENYLDAGQAINPAAAAGQSEGGMAQGLGYALFEDILLDEGRVLNPRLSGYIIPSIRDVPADLKTVLLEEAEPLGPYGARGIAEIVLSPTAAAIMNALYDAIGVRFDRVPVTPELVLEELEKKD